MRKLLVHHQHAWRIVAIGLLLQTAGLAWLAVVMQVDMPYTDLVPAFVLAGLAIAVGAIIVGKVTAKANSIPTD